MSQLKAAGVVEPHEKEYVAKDGRRLPVLVGSALLDHIGGGSEEIAAYVVDLTAQKNAEADLRDREALLVSIFRSEGLYTAVLDLIDDDVVFVMSNERNAAIYGRSAAEMTGSGLSEAGLSEDAAEGWLTFLRDCHVKADVTTLEFPFSLGGQSHHFLGTFTPLPPSPAGHPRLSVVALDISERKRLEEQQALVTRELHHRVKNTLATVQALVSSTARYATTIAEFQHSVTDRIASLAKTHTLLIDDQWGGAGLKTYCWLSWLPTTTRLASGCGLKDRTCTFHPRWRWQSAWLRTTHHQRGQVWGLFAADWSCSRGRTLGNR